MTITDALNKLFSQREWYKPLGIEKETAHQYRKRLKANKLSLNKQIEIAKKAGFEIEEIKVKD